MAVVGAMALSTPTSARAEQPDITRYRKLGSGVILKDVVEGEAAEVREGDLVQFNYVCRRANDYFVHSTVDQFNGESRPVTLALGGEEVTSFTPEFVYPPEMIPLWCGQPYSLLSSVWLLISLCS
ncbi:Peptidyl-prolyl cis-trans isomerase FKBP16-1 chloroplastic [Zea mays]|uniref:Peptidyl-prolyl cis-trans isomerase FKBP16-1 chloroplastic n=1 Tax=Zea mays TaxID=4577 RepID=A0A1D6J0V0_MAIZE|nr:Peptidyl-prolyl cis-trans isomerase FKBP16-1 chloroplastic [Zea mays]